MKLIITYKSGRVEKLETDKIRIVGSTAYIGMEEWVHIKLDNVVYFEVFNSI